jgi:hypothetical protein
MSRNRRHRGGESPGGGPQQSQGTTTQIIRGRSVDLGDLSGEAVEPVLAEFGYFGTKVRVNPDLTETTVIDLFERAKQVQIEDSPNLPIIDALTEAEKAKDHVRAHIHPDDFDAFWSTAKSNRQDMRRLMGLCWEILALISERPTVPPSDSSAGRPITSQSLPDGVSSPDDAEPTADGSWWPDGLPYNPDAVAVVERYERQGRPDLANQIMVTQEAMAGVSAGPTG